jgi:hypothetical protein
VTLWLLLTQRRHFTVDSNNKRHVLTHTYVYAVDDEKINRALEDDLRPSEEMYSTLKHGLLVIGPSILVYNLIDNQQMRQMTTLLSSQMLLLLHVSAYQRHHEGAHMILTSYLYVGVHYKKNL